MTQIHSVCEHFLDGQCTLLLQLGCWRQIQEIIPATNPEAGQ